MTHFIVLMKMKRRKNTIFTAKKSNSILQFGTRVLSVLKLNGLFFQSDFYDLFIQYFVLHSEKARKGWISELF